MEATYEEVLRILKPGGCAAFFTYRVCPFSDAQLTLQAMSGQIAVAQTVLDSCLASSPMHTQYALQCTHCSAHVLRVA